MSDEIKERAVEIVRTFAEKVISGEATGDDVGTLREGLRGIAEELGVDLTNYDENIRPALDEAQENFDVVEFKGRLRSLVENVCVTLAIDPEELKNVCDEE